MENFDLKQKRDGLWKQLSDASNAIPFDREAFDDGLRQLSDINRFWAYPGRRVLLRFGHYLEREHFVMVRQLVNNCCRQLHAGRYRRRTWDSLQDNLDQLDRPALQEDRRSDPAPVPGSSAKPYFEVLVVHPHATASEALIRQNLLGFQSAQDEFTYDIVLVDSAEDALNAVLANTDIQACVYFDRILSATARSRPVFDVFSKTMATVAPPDEHSHGVEAALCRGIRGLRPELNHYLVTQAASTNLSPEVRERFNRVLFHPEPFHDVHAAILNGVRNRFFTPFFDALQTYSRRPKGVFHALPLSRGASVSGSPWISDMLDFYGDNIFLAETSSTQGGLDSLLDPTGAIKQAHMKAANAFGADTSYFVTNGTSTSNKIVMQANLKPGDIVLVSADCHKSVPYAVTLAGAYPIFLETYPLPEYDIYGGIDLKQIKAVMLDLKKQGRLDSLKQITLTNSTFDGLIYHSENFMMDILAIKPDVIFHWDEAWFAFAHFHPLYRGRTAMSAVRNIRMRMRCPEYRRFHAQWSAEFERDGDQEKWQQRLYPDPEQVRLRVYVTQSTHKTLTAFRQGSMIHVADARFDQAHFLEAFRIHTSTSPNYQIIASLDIGRRQVDLEGFHRVREAILLSLQLRQRVRDSEVLQPYFDVLDDEHMIPAGYREAPPQAGCDASLSGLAAMRARWETADFAVDPTRVTLDITRTGLDGNAFRQLLMTRYDIQVNKTSRNTVLFLVTIGTAQSTVDYLLQVLHDMTARFQSEHAHHPPLRLVERALPLPGKRSFHPAFAPFDKGDYQACDMRSAFFDGSDEANTEYMSLSAHTIQLVGRGRTLVSASFVTPYPPGFPVIVPGQIITVEMLRFFQHIKVKEIHGFDIERGFRIFRDAYLAQLEKTWEGSVEKIERQSA